MIDGELQKNTTIEEAENKGVVCIQQELALVEELSILEKYLYEGTAKQAWDRTVGRSSTVKAKIFWSGFRSMLIRVPR